MEDRTEEGCAYFGTGSHGVGVGSQATWAMSAGYTGKGGREREREKGRKRVEVSESCQN